MINIYLSIEYIHCLYVNFNRKINNKYKKYMPNIQDDQYIIIDVAAILYFVWFDGKVWSLSTKIAEIVAANDAIVNDDTLNRLKYFIGLCKYAKDVASHNK